HQEPPHGSDGADRIELVLPPHRQFDREDSLSRWSPRLLLHSLPASLFPDRRPPWSMADPAARSPPRGGAILREACSPASARSCASFALPLLLRVPRFRRPAQYSSVAALSPRHLARSWPCRAGHRAAPE